MDNLDQIAKKKYGDYNYWHALAAYNDIVSPFGLISQGITEISLFNKTDYDALESTL